MIDQLMNEPIPALHPDSLCAEQATQTLRYLMRHHASEHPARHWAAMVSVPHWREDRPEMIRLITGYGWNGDTDGRAALVSAELHVMAIEAVAAHWEPEQCQISTVRIDGAVLISLVSSVEGSRSW